MSVASNHHQSLINYQIIFIVNQYKYFKIIDIYINNNLNKFKVYWVLLIGHYARIQLFVIPQCFHLLFLLHLTFKSL